MKMSLLLLMLLPFQANADDSWCEARFWPLERDLALPEMKAELESLDRFKALQYAWGDLTSAQEKPVFAPILQYLAGTEKSKDLSGYYKAMGYFALGQVELVKAVADWPKNRKPHDGKGFSQKELCDLFVKSGGKPPVMEKKGKAEKKKSARK